MTQKIDDDTDDNEEFEESCWDGLRDDELTESADLTLALLRRANVARQAAYRNAAGNPVDCSDWTLEDWFCATLGELGEAANVAKKIRRGDFTLEEGRERLASELADTLTYLDLLAWAAGIDLAAATERKFDEVSARIDYPTSLRDH